MAETVKIPEVSVLLCLLRQPRGLSRPRAWFWLEEHAGRNVFLFDVLVSGMGSLISLSDLSLIVYGNAIYFYEFCILLLDEIH